MVESPAQGELPPPSPTTPPPPEAAQVWSILLHISAFHNQGSGFLQTHNNQRLYRLVFAGVLEGLARHTADDEGKLINFFFAKSRLKKFEVVRRPAAAAAVKVITVDDGGGGLGPPQLEADKCWFGMTAKTYFGKLHFLSRDDYLFSLFTLINDQPYVLYILNLPTPIHDIRLTGRPP